MDAATKIALYNALSWIESKKNDAGIDTENVEVGIQCLTYVNIFHCVVK